MSRILVVEDQPENVEILKRLLGRKKHDVLVANTKEDAVATAVAERPDLILMDITIPNAAGEEANPFGGIEATRLIKAAETTKTIPVIAMTASVMPHEKKRFLEAGCDAVHPKPFEFAALLETIERHLVVGTNA